MRVEITEETGAITTEGREVATECNPDYKKVPAEEKIIEIKLSEVNNLIEERKSIEETTEMERVTVEDKVKSVKESLGE